MKRVEWFGSSVSMAKEEINGNHYVVLVYDFGSGDKHKQRTTRTVIVFGSDDDHGFPDTPYDVQKEYDEVTRGKQSMYRNPDPLETHVSQTVNEAVCTLENKLEEKQAFEDSVNAALEANREVHEGIDYQLEHGPDND